MKYMKLPYNHTIKHGNTCFSGFYEEGDLKIIKEAATKLGLTYLNHKKNSDWVAARFIK